MGGAEEKLGQGRKRGNKNVMEGRKKGRKEEKSREMERRCISRGTRNWRKQDDLLMS